jgi:hypothetical protein
MDVLSTIITSAAAAVAIGMGAVSARVLREERRRTQARLIALVQLSANESIAAPPDSGAHACESSHVSPAVHSEPEEPMAVSFHARGHSDREGVELEPCEVRGVSQLFSERPTPSPWPGRFVIIAGAAALVCAVSLIAWSSNSDSATNGTASAQRAAAPPLELLSLRHTQTPNSLTVTGLVQNPRGAAALTRVSAVAFLFARDGTLLASGKAPLDFTSLAPGDESAFVITVPVNGTVARYRVSFRSEDGRALAHIDRRHTGTVARTE